MLAKGIWPIFWYAKDQYEITMHYGNIEDAVLTQYACESDAIEAPGRPVPLAWTGPSMVAPTIPRS